jgi:undecaprenyl-diphosphatase
MTTAEAVILAIVEGLTEFIPVSSTGHLILTEAALKMQENTYGDFLKVFTVGVQFGAILAVVLLYWKRFFQSLDFYFKIFVAFLPAAVVGLLLHKQIEALLSSVLTVAVSLIVGGVILILVDKIFHRQIEESEHDEDTVTVKELNEFGVDTKKEVLKKFEIGWMQAFIIGCFQTVSMVPGVSRSAATIVGGLTQKLNIKRAAEFSFFLAVPTILGAATLELYKNFYRITGENIDLLIIGNVISFVVGMIAIRFFIGLITRFGLKIFGYYRVLLGICILILYALGHLHQIKVG